MAAAVKPLLSPTGRSAVFFWKREDPSLGYLCQWFYLPFRDRADPPVEYPTAEHYMMYHKAMLFSDAAVAAAVLAETSPKKVSRNISLEADSDRV